MSYTDSFIERVENAQQVAYPDDSGNPENFVANLLTDVRHFCDRHGLDFGHIDRQAYQSYCRDLGEARRIHEHPGGANVHG